MFWRKKKEEAPAPAPAPSLSEASTRLDGSVEEINKKLQQCDEELLAYRKNPSPSGKTRAMQVLKRKKMLENQRNTLYNTLGVVEETSHSISTMETISISVNAMRAAVQTSSKLAALTKIEDVEDLMDEMQDFVEQQQEISEIFNSSLGVVDEGELEAEFAALEAQIPTSSSPQLSASNAAVAKEDPAATLV